MSSAVLVKIDAENQMETNFWVKIKPKTRVNGCSDFIEYYKYLQTNYKFKQQ